MAGGINRGEIWMYTFRPPDQRRPVLVLTRQQVIPLLDTVMVAPITRSIRGAPSEVLLGIDQGLKHPCAVNLDHVQTVEQARLEQFVGSATPTQMQAVCRALAIAAGCD